MIYTNKAQFPSIAKHPINQIDPATSEQPKAQPSHTVFQPKLINEMPLRPLTINQTANCSPDFTLTVDLGPLSPLSDLAVSSPDSTPTNTPTNHQTGSDQLALESLEVIIEGSLNNLFNEREYVCSESKYAEKDLFGKQLNDWLLANNLCIIPIAAKQRTITDIDTPDENTQITVDNEFTRKKGASLNPSSSKGINDNQ